MNDTFLKLYQASSDMFVLIHLSARYMHYAKDHIPPGCSQTNPTQRIIRLD
jgi:hypothetical protein